MMNRKGLTLIELLAVIVILAVVLVIGVPIITHTINKSKLGSLKDSALLILKNAEQEYMIQKATNPDFNSIMDCSDLSNMSDDYAECTLEFYAEGKASIIIKGSSSGKFANMQCSGTRNGMNCRIIEDISEYTDAVEYLTAKYNNGTNNEGLIQTNGTELRYQGADPNNYVYFNCTDNSNPTESTCEIWRIVGVFGGRVKLVRKDSIGRFSWDTVSSSDTHVNNGGGINQWGPSGTYEGADLMRELNGDYLNSSLSANANWYNGINNKKEGVFNKSYVLKESAQELIGDATWYTGGISCDTSVITLADAYAAERGTQGKMCTSEEKYCDDEVERTYTWTGKVGLIYPSDYGYASGNSNCATNIFHTNSMDYCNTNWMASYGWTITPAHFSSHANLVWVADSTLVYYYSANYTLIGAHPSVYLVPGILIKGSGTSSNPYSFA